MNFGLKCARNVPMADGMSIWSILSLAVLGVVYLTGFIALAYCVKCAPAGYEDVDGFHVGEEPGAGKNAPRNR
ncbi:MAG: hypothetical protein JNG82_12625 [Opitutaceae bacterium]|nr:hypothetical protein [Opitutaceae bacterium]